MTDPRTSLAEERAEQRRWRLRPAHAGLTVFDRLVENEFRPPELLERAAAASLGRVIAHAVETVPYWRRRFARSNLVPADIAGSADLVRLPVLSKRALREFRESFRARKLPEGEKIFGWFVSSGTTGEPTRVQHTESSNWMFSYLVQRQYRWFRFDPTRCLAVIRPPHSLPPRRDGRAHGDDATGRHLSWRYVGTFFRTGPLVYASASLPAERLLSWLTKTRPDYLQCYSETLEHLALACDGEWPVPSLCGSLAIAQQLTSGMRHRIEGVTGVPVHQGYGLNEIGMVAVRCAAGRYHVHAEHCIVEIVDDNGRPCPAGEVGHVVVTALRNPAMPLLRYDTGDLAEAVEGPCACGRTLPCFGEIQGRYSRMAHLPPGTAATYIAFRTRIGRLPRAIVTGLRQYQLHQFRDGTFELRLVTAGAPAARLAEALRTAWAESGGAPGALRIVEVEAIPLPTGGKFQDFTSDFMPAADSSSAR